MQSPEKKTRVAILGGSFDPPTIAHMQIVCEIYNNLNDIDEIWIVPCGDGRSDKKLRTPSCHRLKMLELIKDDIIPKNAPIFIDQTEVKKGEYMPTYHLLKELSGEHKDKEFIFCIGTDLLDTLHTWDVSEKLTSEYEFIVLSREDYEFKENLPGVMYPKKYQVLNINISGSSTQIRERIKGDEGKKVNFRINGLTSNRVIKYIKENKLYNIK